MIRWSIATVCMGGALEAKLAAAAKAGFRAVEIFENDLTFFSGKPREARDMAADLGLEIVALQPMRDFEAMPDPIRARNFERAARKFDLMHELGARLLCLCSNVSDEAIDDPQRAAQDLAELADLARQHGFRIGYEALAWGRHVKDWTAAWDIVRAADRANLGIVLDSFHACVRNNPIEPMSTLPADRIALVQVADAPAIQMDPLSLSRHYRCYPGQGDYPIVDFLDAITRTGYRGPVSLEIFNDQFRGASANSIALDGLRALRMTGEQLAARRQERDEPPLIDLAPLPPAPRVERIEFIEFATGDADSAAFASLIEGLGFRLAARHRSKDVDLYRQGEINLVVNREREGFAHAFNMLHGPSVCALALRVDAVERALERARAMECPIYFGKIGPGEALIPAAGGVEGSLLYFIDAGAASHWERDFIEEPAFADSAALRKIDHLSNVVRRSEFLTWSLFYKSVLGFRLEPQVEIADPHGAFFSRSLRSPGDNVRIALNVSEGGATGVSRFLDAFGGAGFQQIALSTPDIFAAVEAAQAKGVAFLAIPDNYYDDLAARFDLVPDLLARMRSLGVLYDRVKDGEFFHIYSRTFKDRFFFEIVQRRNYDLFGAANTPARLAAQALAQDAETGLRLDLGL
ncbi:bifunctional sugar phosphate isomerase/epimerase/4-hydroxyphenylpyruvate dioxygenase family protein [Methylocapsa sp. S129]|uniref:bifunctional sugar phosphate isomerase/epimerase/4-hydroxyphenylpyruvate dioxygenase family protein n=1 Tax=Methylocapsa sp. S129 TaxID=1641869 RepID=UPI00131C37AB|nr:sugar phosphate isomerase/epimerase and 4-hydroxyphenylpyruvate domain-containing protein [Methylocapsa sp. S129]